MRAAAAFCVGFLAADFAATVLPLRLFWYLPIERRFEFVAHPLTLGMDYYGRVLLCLICGAVAAMVGSRLPKRFDKLLSGWSAVLLVFVLVMQVHLLVNRQIDAGR